MLCPVCQLELGVERRADELVLTYTWKEWAARCRNRARGDPVSCAMLRPIIAEIYCPRPKPLHSGRNRVRRIWKAARASGD